MQGAAGMIPQPAGYLKRVREIADQFGLLLIADEVATGFGRTGKMFACNHEDISPDIICLAKGITGGYLPLAATLTTEQIYQMFLGKFEEFKAFFHGHTYTGNPLAAAVAVANLQLFQDESLIDALQEKITYLSSRLADWRQHPFIGDIRQRGFMVGIELVKDKSSKEPFPVEQRQGHKVILAARKLGAILRPLGDVIVLMPPLSISREELKELLDITFQAIDTACSNLLILIKSKYTIQTGSYSNFPALRKLSAFWASSGVSTSKVSKSVSTTLILKPYSKARNCSSFSAASQEPAGRLTKRWRNSCR